MKKFLLVVLLIIGVMVVSGCGKSADEKVKNAVESIKVNSYQVHYNNTIIKVNGNKIEVYYEFNERTYYYELKNDKFVKYTYWASEWSSEELDISSNKHPLYDVNKALDLTLELKDYKEKDDVYTAEYYAEGAPISAEFRVLLSKEGELKEINVPFRFIYKFSVIGNTTVTFPEEVEDLR